MRLIILFLSFAISCSPVFSQLNKFGKPASFADKGTLYQYKKSNWDGTHSSSVYLYVADTNRLESFKWYEGDEVATLVTATIDWNIYSVSEFQNHKLRKGKDPEFTAKLKMTDEKQIRIEVGEMRDSLLIAGLPWQSYDFDFAGLSFIWRALKDKQDAFWFHIADAAQVDGKVAFINKGKVDVKFLGYEMVNGKNCFKCAVDGAGLENRGGHIWINRENFMIEQYKIELPDEPGFENGMLQFVKATKMNHSEWEKFMKKCINE
jgi:hypothetical protein